MEIIAFPAAEPDALTVREILQTSGGLARGRPIPTGFSPLDDALDGGVRAGDLTVVGGRPGVGKTVAALQAARSAALAGHDALFICYEHQPAQLVGRLLGLEAAEAGDVTEDDRAATRHFAAGEMALADLLAESSRLRAAHSALSAYADRLRIFRGSSAHTGLAEIDELIRRNVIDRGLVVVDYLQKVATHTHETEDERVIHLAEGLKELALSRRLAVVAIVTAAPSGLVSRRVRLHDVRGAVALAYEADVAIMLNEKATAVSKVHLAYDDVRARTFRDVVVFSIEKNRGGPAPVDLEFRKAFADFRFDPHGAYVADRLVDSAMVEE
jgi:replicative DNA helicase